MLDTYLKWFVAHERLIIIAVALSFAFVGTTKYLDYASHKADIEATTSAKTAEIQKQYVDQLTQTVAQHDAAAAQERAASDAEIAALVQTVVARDAATAKKVADVTQTTDPIIAVNNLASAYAPYSFGDPIPVSNNGRIGFTVADVNLFTATKIQSDTCSADLTDTKTQLTDSQKNTASALSQVTDRDKLIAGMKDGEAKDAQAWKDEKSALVKDARKSKWKIFWLGVASGFVGRQLLIK